MKRPSLLLISLLILASLGTGCVSVAAYQKMYLNDPDMALTESRGRLYDQTTEAYREGAAGANGGKAGGGCGCN
ncbi:MAG: DUF4266 domain-containing protein [Bacteroidota bacterium]